MSLCRVPPVIPLIIKLPRPNDFVGRVTQCSFCKVDLNRPYDFFEKRVYNEYFLHFSFALALEKACVDCVEAGQMTKDLAGCIYGLKK